MASAWCAVASNWSTHPPQAHQGTGPGTTPGRREMLGSSTKSEIYWPWQIGFVVLTILKHMKVNGKDYPIYEMENKKCSKPPTSKSSWPMSCLKNGVPQNWRIPSSFSQFWGYSGSKLLGCRHPEPAALAYWRSWEWRAEGVEQRKRRLSTLLPGVCHGYGAMERIVPWIPWNFDGDLEAHHF